jgi:hypothetical protein
LIFSEVPAVQEACPAGDFSGERQRGEAASMNPRVGETKRGRELGLIGNRLSTYFVCFCAQIFCFEFKRRWLTPLREKFPQKSSDLILTVAAFGDDAQGIR